MVRSMSSSDPGGEQPATATATDVVTIVSEMLRQADLNTFDLAMWFNRPRYDE